MAAVPNSRMESRPKRIVICCDGTWQSAVSGEKNQPSNVTRLARNLNEVGVDEQDKEWQQVVWYDSGVGTTSGFLGRKLEGAIGQGLEGNVIEAYNFCVLNYAIGDQILVFGFSRGAYTARTIAGLITDIGICKPSGLHEFHEIWKLYKQNPPGERFYGSDAYFDFVYGVEADPEEQPKELDERNYDKVWRIYPHSDWSVTEDASREIEVVGVYDTVGALGMPSVLGYEAKFLFGPDKLGFHNVKLNPNIKNAFHALALDEHREAFSPTVWHLPEREITTQAQYEAAKNAEDEIYEKWKSVRQDLKVPKEERDALKKQFYEARRKTLITGEHRRPRSNLLQVWFPGVHINIGGGSSDTLEDKGDLEETSNMTFAWMLDQVLSKKLLSVDKKAVLGEAHRTQRRINYLNHLASENERKAVVLKAENSHASWGKWIWNGISSAAYTVTHPFTPGPSTTQRVQGWGTGTIIDSFSLMYRLNGSKPRTPGAYTKDKKRPTPGKTNEQVHPSVGYRIEMTKNEVHRHKRYRPAHTHEGEFVRRKAASGKGWEYVIQGVADPMPEYVMKSAPRNAQPKDSPYERYAVVGKEAQDYVSALDREYGFDKQFMGLPNEADVKAWKDE